VKITESIRSKCVEQLLYPVEVILSLVSYIYFVFNADTSVGVAHDISPSQYSGLFVDGSDKKDDMSEMSGNKGNSNGITKEQLAQIKKLRTQLKWSTKEVEDKSERMFSSRDVTKLNSVMATAFIAFLQNQGNGNGDESSQY